MRGDGLPRAGTEEGGSVTADGAFARDDVYGEKVAIHATLQGQSVLAPG